MSSSVALDSNAVNQVSRGLNNNNNSNSPQNVESEIEKKLSQIDDRSKKLSNEEKPAELNKIDAKLNVLSKDAEETADTEIEDAIEIVSEFMQLSNKNVNFAQADGSDRTVIKVFDSESKELIKQFPSAEILAIAQKIVELRQDVGTKTGILLDEKV